MSDFIRLNFTISVFLVILFVLVGAFTVIACDSETISNSNSETQPSTTNNTTLSSTTTPKPTGVEGSTLLPEDAPEADHFIGGGGCFEHHGIPLGHEGEVLNQFGCDRCHVQTSTIIPTITPEST